MKPLVIIWIALFIGSFVWVILFSKNGFKKKFSSETDKRQWNIMGGRTNYYRLAIATCLFLSAVATYLIKLIFRM